MKPLRYILKSAAMAAIFTGFFLAGAAVRLLMGRGKARMRIAAETTSLFSSLALKTLNIRPALNGSCALNLGAENYLIVTNHLSYLDILIISSMIPACFVSSVEMRQAGFLGAMARSGGTIFVERRKKSYLPAEVESLALALRNGLNVVVFPEGTTSNGDGVLAFKASLLEAASLAQKNILPLCISYKTLDGQPITPGNRDTIFWYGKMGFLPHFLKLISTNSIEAEVTCLAEECIDSGESRKETARRLHASISGAYVSSLTFPAANSR